MSCWPVLFISGASCRDHLSKAKISQKMRADEEGNGGGEKENANEGSKQRRSWSVTSTCLWVLWWIVLNLRKRERNGILDFYFFWKSCFCFFPPEREIEEKGFCAILFGVARLEPGSEYFHFRLKTLATAENRFPERDRSEIWGENPIYPHMV